MWHDGAIKPLVYIADTHTHIQTITRQAKSKAFGQYWFSLLTRKAAFAPSKVVEKKKILTIWQPGFEQCPKGLNVKDEPATIQKVLSLISKWQ